MKKQLLILALSLTILCSCTSTKAKKVEKAFITELRSMDKLIIERHSDGLLIHMEKDGTIYCEHNGIISELTFDQLAKYFIKKARE